LQVSYSFDLCNKYRDSVKKAHRFYFGIDFPYWYSVAQLRVESNCIWRTFSKDGWGSVGPAQITPKFWDKELSELFPDWKESPPNYFMAQAYILYKMHKQNKCQKLYVTYQCYNRSCRKVVQENYPECKWEKGFEKCKPEMICVWRKDNLCKQWKSSCDINYEYSYKVWEFGRVYREGEDGWKWRYW